MAVYRLADDSFVFPPAEEAEEMHRSEAKGTSPEATAKRRASGCADNGLLAVGGDYRVERLLVAYSSGIFPWPVAEGRQITWFSPDPRFVLKAADLHIPKSLAKTLRKDLFEYRVDTAFPEVIHACSSVPRPGQDGTWITEDLEKGYCELNQRGFAHSFEAWQGGKLAGGFYGVAIGPCFFEESMFARVPDASKCAFATFAKRMFDNGVPLIDCQVYTDHLARFGAREIPRSEYLLMLSAALVTKSPVDFCDRISYNVNMNICKGLFAVTGAFVAGSVFASGFALNEASSKTYAMGGAVLGRAADASANFHNPATLTDITNITVTVGAMTEHPRARIKATHDGVDYPSSPMNSGCYLLPHFHLAVPLPWDFVFGLGIMPEYGLGSEYDDTWALNYASTDTQVQSFTINPNLAWKVTDKLSVGAGLRFLYWDFEQYSRPYYTAEGRRIAQLGNRLKGDNGMSDLGYQIGLKYDVFDNFSVGVNYKSLTVCHVEGKREMGGNVMGNTIAKYYDADATLEMPQSITGGFNWDITDDWHLGGVIGWTQWSTIDNVYFHFVDGMSRQASQSLCSFNWRDTWRFGLAPSWDFAEHWSWIASYVFETDCARDQYSTMLPPSERHLISTGLVWECLKNLELALTYGIILMDGLESHVSKDLPTDTYKAYRGISHAAGFSVTYRF